MIIDLDVLIKIIKFAAELITSCGIILVFVKKYLDKMVSKITTPILEKIDKMDKNQCMNYLTEFLADVRSGVHKTEYQKARAHDVYKHYSTDLNGNSYIHEQWELYMTERSEKR